MIQKHSKHIEAQKLPKFNDIIASASLFGPAVILTGPRPSRPGLGNSVINREKQMHTMMAASLLKGNPCSTCKKEVLDDEQALQCNIC